MITTVFVWSKLNNYSAFAGGVPVSDVNAKNHFGICTPNTMIRSISFLESTDPTDLSGPQFPKYEVPFHGCGSGSGGGGGGTSGS